MAGYLVSEANLVEKRQQKQSTSGAGNGLEVDAIVPTNNNNIYYYYYREPSDSDTTSP